MSNIQLVQTTQLLPTAMGKDLSNPVNRRPISLLNTMSKVLEKLFLIRLGSQKFVPINMASEVLTGHQLNFLESLTTSPLILI